MIELHHSIDQWDRSEPIQINLDTIVYHSAPACLRFQDVAPFSDWLTILSRHAEAQCIKDGRLVTWGNFRRGNVEQPFCFRNQAPLGTANLTNCYFTTVDKHLTRLWIRQDDVNTSLGQWFAEMTLNTWEHWRLSWWSALTNGGVSTLLISLEKEIDDEWVEQGAPVEYAANTWHDSEINRCGFQGNPYNSYHVRVDDSEIWTRT